MIERASNQSTKYLFGLNLRESVAVALFGVLIALSKLVVRMPLSIPGHTGAVWMAIFTMCCLIYRKAGAGTLAGFIAGIFSVMLFPSKEGLLTFFKYFVPGILMDVFFGLIPFLAKRWYATALTAALCHASKLMVNFVSGLILHLPLGFLTLGLKVAVIDHIIFGFIGGAFGYLICNKTIIKKSLAVKT